VITAKGQRRDGNFNTPKALYIYKKKSFRGISQILLEKHRCYTGTTDSPKFWPSRKNHKYPKFVTKKKFSTTTLIKVIAFAEVFTGQWHHFKPTKNTPLDWIFFCDTNLVSIQKISKIFL
jgi:hypothetical protein